MGRTYYNRTYKLLSEAIQTNGTKFRYNRKIKVLYLNSGSLSFTVKEEKNSFLDFDFIMSWLGNALYPMTVRMDSSGEATGIENIDEVKERYTAEGQKIIDYYEQDSLVADYVKGCIETVYFAE